MIDIIDDEGIKELLYEFEFFLSRNKGRKIWTKYWNKDEFNFKVKT